MKNLGLHLIFLFLFTTCGSRNDGTVKFNQALTSSAQIQGGVVLYAEEEGTGNSRTYTFRTGDEFEAASLEFPENSVWSFRAFSWEGDTALGLTSLMFTGTMRCATLFDFSVGTGTQTVDINLLNTKCFEDLIPTFDSTPSATNPFDTDTMNASFNKFKSIQVIGCGSTQLVSAVDDATNPAAQGRCNSTAKQDQVGISESFRVKIVSNNPQQIGESSVSSSCVNNSAPGTTYLSSFNIPIGYTTGPSVEYILEGFEDEDCDDGAKELFIKNGLADITSQETINGSLEVVGFQDDGSLLTYVFADTISGVGSSPLSSILPKFTCNGGDCVPAYGGTDVLDTYDYVLRKNAGNVTFYVEGLTSPQCTGTWTPTALGGGGGLTFGAITPNYDTPQVGWCQVTVVITSGDSFSNNQYMSIDSPGSVVTKTAWILNNHELDAREILFDVFGNPDGTELVEEFDNNPTNQNYDGRDDSIIDEIRSNLGAKYIGGILSAGYPGVSCAALNDPVGKTFLYNSNEGLKSVTVKIEDSPANPAIEPRLICEDADLNDPTIACPGNLFDKKLTLLFDNVESQKWYFHCTKKLGMVLFSEEGDRKNLMLWNTEDANKQRVEAYYYENQDSGEISSGYERLVKDSAEQYYYWASSYRNDSGTETAEQVHITNNYPHGGGECVNYKIEYYDAAAFATYSGTTPSWTDGTGDGFYSSFPAVCLNLDTMIDPGGGTPAGDINLHGVAGNDHTAVPGGDAFSNPYLGSGYQSWHLLFIKNLNANFPDINSF